MENFDTSNKEHKNLLSKIKNTVADLNWYAHRFLELHGTKCHYRQGISTAKQLSARGWTLRPELYKILDLYEKCSRLTPENANRFFYDTWIYLHDQDNKLRNENL